MIVARQNNHFLSLSSQKKVVHLLYTFIKQLWNKLKTTN